MTGKPPPRPFHDEIASALAGDPAPLAPRAMLGGYVLLEKLGQGAFGEVWRAEHMTHGRVVAIKVFLRELFSPAERAAAAARFVDGVTAMQKLRGDPYAVELFEGPTVSSEQLWFAMRYYPAKDLQRWIEQNPNTTYETRLRLVGHVLCALETAHARGVIHRDVRPGNILIDDTQEPRAVLADFDIAYFANGRRRRSSSGGPDTSRRIPLV